MSTYPHVLKDKCLPSLQHSWLFLANSVLCFSSAIETILGLPNSSFYYIAVNITTETYLHCLMNISSIMIGISTSQIKTKMKKNALVLLTKDSASNTARISRTQSRNVSIAFMVFSAKCMLTINVWSSIFCFATYAKPELIIIAAYHMIYLFFLTTVLHQTYSA